MYIPYNQSIVDEFRFDSFRNVQSSDLKKNSNKMAANTQMYVNEVHISRQPNGQFEM